MPNDNKYNSTNICECCFRSPHYSSVIADTGKCDKCGFIGDCWDCDLIDFYRSLPLSITDEEILEFLPRLQRKGLTSNKIYGLVEIGLRIKTCIEKRNDNNHSSLIADTGKRTGLSTHSLLEHLPTSLMPTQQANGSHSLIAITARSGGGKSLLAQSLNANIANGCLIDAGERCHYQHKSFDISPLITNNDITYIIDDSRYITDDSLTTLFQHTKQGGTIIVFMQHKSDLPLPPNVTATWFTLHDNQLTEQAPEDNL